MYTDNLDQEKIKRLQKERDYYKWKSENPNASPSEKKRAYKIFSLCDTFNAPTTDEEQAKIDTVTKELDWLLDVSSHKEFEHRFNLIVKRARS